MGRITEDKTNRQLAEEIQAAVNDARDKAKLLQEAVAKLAGSVELKSIHVPVPAWRIYLQYGECPCCCREDNGTEQVVYNEANGYGLIKCQCGALYGVYQDTLDDSYGLVADELESAADGDPQTYFDFTAMNETGRKIARRHGWYNTDTGRMTQIG